jgi:acyl dehydratase
MKTRSLDSPPRILPLYARAAAPMIPGASRLPFLPGGGGEIPEIELTLDGVRSDPEAVAAYDRVCGFPLRDDLPPTYPHVLAFPLHMAVMADGGFPFGAVGLVHLENRIAQRRPIGVGEELSLAVRPTALQPHPKGRTFSLITEARAGGELVWESESTMLRRQARGSDAVAKKSYGERTPDGGPAPGASVTERPATAEWKLGGDLGRRYAAVSGDRNPIHLHRLTAKPFGFSRPIAHGMWTKARCLAALDASLPDAYDVQVEFRKPILLPGKVAFERAGERFRVRGGERVHLEGRLSR